MFNGASAFNQNLASWNVLRVTSFTSNFDSTTALSSCNKGAIYAAWGATFQAAWPTFTYACTVGSVACAMCITNANIGAAATAWVTNPTTAATTYGNIADWNTAAVSNMYQLFYNKPTFNADIGKWNVASVTSMWDMFWLATAFNRNIGWWNTASVAAMWGTLAEATAFNINIGSWNTASVTTMASVRPLLFPIAVVRGG
jgi:surface protein